MAPSRRSVLGLRLDGPSFTNVTVAVGANCGEPVPVAQAVGIPLRVQRRPMAETRGYAPYLACAFMTQPVLGAPEAAWQYGGRLGRCPAVVYARTDGVAFGVREWEVLNDFIAHHYDCDECEAETAPHAVTRKDFVEFLREYDTSGSLFLDVRHPRAPKPGAKDGVERSADADAPLVISSTQPQVQVTSPRRFSVSPLRAPACVHTRWPEPGVRAVYPPPRAVNSP